MDKKELLREIGKLTIVKCIHCSQLSNATKRKLKVFDTSRGLKYQLIGICISCNIKRCWFISKIKRDRIIEINRELRELKEQDNSDNFPNLP